MISYPREGALLLGSTSGGGKMQRAKTNVAAAPRGLDFVLGGALALAG